jgi:hypothetical protein
MSLLLGSVLDISAAALPIMVEAIPAAVPTINRRREYIRIMG